MSYSGYTKETGITQNVFNATKFGLESLFAFSFPPVKILTDTTLQEKDTTLQEYLDIEVSDR